MSKNLFKNVYAGKRVLVTGHTGFKGSWLSLWLLDLGAKVAGYSNKVPTSPSHFELLGLEDKIEHFSGDIRNKEGLESALDSFKPEIVFHLAAQALVHQSYRDPVETYETNIMGMVNLMDCLRTRPGIETAVLITSDKAYRNDEWCWGYRETDALGGHDPYSSSKSCADLIARSFYDSFLKDAPTRIGITRAGNVIGGGDWGADRIVPDCIRAWAQDKEVEVRSPKATRPWQHVLEPLSGYLALGAELYNRDTKLDGEAFNFGPDADVNQTVAELLNEMSTHWDKAKWGTPENVQQIGSEAMLLKLSCDKALHYLNWKAVLNFPQTVDFTTSWYQNWFESKEDIFNFSTSQIEKYCQLAKEKGLSWIGPNQA
jgi:CDP-glucose 4,6-dehydratase